jgi:hypothetical protein
MVRLQPMAKWIPIWRCASVVRWRTGSCYAYWEYQRERQTPDVYATDILRVGEWIPASLIPLLTPATSLMAGTSCPNYQRLGLKLQHADISVEAGIFHLYQGLLNGSLKIFATCTQLLAKLRYYHRNECGQVVKKNDHCVDCLRYACMAPPPRQWSWW